MSGAMMRSRYCHSEANYGLSKQRQCALVIPVRRRHQVYNIRCQFAKGDRSAGDAGGRWRRFDRSDVGKETVTGTGEGDHDRVEADEE